MPLEDVLDLPCRDEWSTDDLLSTFAIERGAFHDILHLHALTKATLGFLTAKAARPDVYRAGSMIIRAVQASQVPWAFRPPHQGPIPGADQEGIWIKMNEKANLSLMGEVHQAEDSTEAEDVEEEEQEGGSQSDDVDDGSDEGNANPTRFTSAFGALAVEDAEDSSEDEDNESDNQEDGKS